MREYTARDALILIAMQTEPCLECGEPHQFREGMGRKSAGTWAAPDGHPYRRQGAQDFARRVLGLPTDATAEQIAKVTSLLVPSTDLDTD